MRWLFGRSNSGSEGVEQNKPRPPCVSSPAVQCTPEQINISVVTNASPTQRTPSSHTAQRNNNNKEISAHPNHKCVPYDELWSQMQRTTEELEMVRRELSDERRAHDEALTKSQSEVAALRQQLQKESALRSQDRKLLDTRSQELQDAQAYLTIADTVSIAETLSMVGNLNSDIFQVAATVADEAFFQHSKLSKNDVESAQRWLGEDIVRLLHEAGQRDSESRSLVIQTVVQFALTQACLHIRLCWDAALTSTSLGSAYDQIRTKSSQSISARWRVLTRGNVKYIDPAVVEKAALVRIAYVLSIVLAVCGWTGGASANWDNTYWNAVQQKFLPALERVVKDVVALDRAMGEGLMSTDAELVTIAGGEMFDENYMENGFAADGFRVGGTSGGGGNAAKVVGTTDLGLQAGGRGGRAAGIQLLLKPKVVLWSALLGTPHTDMEPL